MLLDRSADFFGFDGWTFLNCAFHGPMPRQAVEALEAAVALRKNPARIRNDYHFTFPDAYRRAIGALIGADPETISLTDSATAGTMVLVNGLDWQSGDEVIVPKAEFPSNRLPWLSLASRGVTLKEVDTSDGVEMEARLLDAVSRQARVLAVSWVSYLDGRRLDLDRLSRGCRDRGVLFVVDGSQGLGGLPFDLTTTPCDLLIGAGYKWLLGPYGLGFVRVAPALADRLHPGNVNWFATEGAEDFNRLADLPLALRPGGRRFDANEPANFFNVAAGTAAARYIATVTPAAIEAHCRSLQDHLVDGLPDGFEPLGVDAPLRSNILCFKGSDEAATQRVFRHLRDRRIAVSSREGAIRVSPHVYNGLSDVDRLLAALRGDASAVARPAEDTGVLHDRLQRLLDLPE